MNPYGDRPDYEISAMLHVMRLWHVRMAGMSYPANTLAQALRIAELHRGRRVECIASGDGACVISPRQILRLQDKLRVRHDLSVGF